MNVFDRIQLNALVGPWATLTPINLTTQGAVDFLVPSASGSSLTTGATRKSGGGSLIGASIIGADSGFNQSDTGTFTWSNGTAAASAGGNHVASSNTFGNGFRVTAAVPIWPDWQILRVWIASSTSHQMTYAASMDDATAVSQSQGIGGGPDAYGDNNAYVNNGSFIIDVKIASEQAGRTVTLDMTRNGGSMGYLIICGAALFKAPLNKFPARGGARAMAISGGMGPFGSR